MLRIINKNSRKNTESDICQYISTYISICHYINLCLCLDTYLYICLYLYIYMKTISEQCKKNSEDWISISEFKIKIIVLIKKDFWSYS